MEDKSLIEVEVESTGKRQSSSSSNVNEESLYSDVVHSLSMATRHTYDTAHPDGHWCGELLSNVTITAEFVFLCQTLKVDPIPDSEAYRRYLLSEQNADGSWGIAHDYRGDISTTAEAYLALKILGVAKNVPEMVQARNFVRGLGGLAKVRVFTRIFLAQFGLFPWNAIPQIPAEFILMPSKSSINIYKISSWARTTMIPLLIIRHHEPIYALPNGTSVANNFLDELWLDTHLQMKKMIPYSAPLSDLWNMNVVGFVFGAVDKALYYLNGLRNIPLLRAYSRRQCVKWILERQEEDGDWGGIFPTMLASVQALLLEGFEPDSPQIRRGLQAIERFAWQDHNGKRIQACVSPVWDTVLMIRALCDASVDLDNERLIRAVKWSVDRQLLGPEGDWRVYNPRLTPGGFSFEYHNKWYPDVDDTAAAILAFVSQDPKCVESDCVFKASIWILGMQCRDGGWAAFDLDNDKLYLNKIPFSDMDSLCDPSTSDVTGRVLEAYGLILRTVNSRRKFTAPDLIDRITVACDRATLYLSHTQESTGVWYGRWGSNYIYGTSNVLCGLAYFSEHDCLVQDMVSSGVQWLRLVQNTDGGWGEDLESYKDPIRVGCGPSTASQTAWAVMGLLAHVTPSDASVQRGIAWLIHMQTVQSDDGGAASWPERKYTGVGFPGHFYLGYTLYRHYFPMMALRRYMKAVKAAKEGLNLSNEKTNCSSA